jgi:hypothetical protein
MIIKFIQKLEKQGLVLILDINDSQASFFLRPTDRFPIY